MVTLGEVLQNLSRRLTPHSETAGLDAQVLLARSLGKNRAWVLAHPEIQLTPEQEQDIESKASRLENGEPLPFVLGSWEFFSREFLVSPAVLIPRPETELLVETALTWLRINPTRRFGCDVGTGSGCIAVSLAAEVPDLRMLAIDISSAALDLARSNAMRSSVSGQIQFLQNDLLDGIAARFDLICANLPYIPTTTLQDLPIYRREPSLALDGGPEGLDLILRLLEQAPGRLLPGGLLLAEIEARQGPAGLILARQAFSSGAVHVLKDLAGQDRLLVVES